VDRDGLRLTSRGRERAWWLLAVAIAAAVLVAVIAKIGGAPAWAQLSLIAVGTGLGLLVVELRARRAQDDKIAVVVRERVADGSEQLQRMGDVRIDDVRVHRAIVDVVYIRRDIEPEVERRLRAERRVLIAGPSMSGKTRLALEVTKRIYADHRLLVPKDGKALHALLAAGLTGARLVVWLDDLERYLAGDGLTTEVLDRFHKQGNVLVGTIRTAAYEALLPAGNPRPPGWDVPDWFGEPVRLTRWTDDDLDRAAARIPARVMAGVRRHGLSAYLGGGPLALKWLGTAETTRRFGYALVRAAADWRRIGASSPVPRPVLVALASVYLGEGSPGTDEEAVREGLEWATRKIDGTVALLEEGDGGYSVLDYALDFLASARTPIPRETWEAALEQAKPGDLVSLGYQVATEHREFAPAQLLGRAEELSAIKEFCAGEAAYQWWRGGPWTGKTALASWLVLHPPAGVTVVSFFITGWLAGKADSTAFTAAVIQQLALVAGEPVLPDETPIARDGQWRRLLEQAAARVGESGGRLLLVVDGLDEDRGAPPTGPASIAALLPARPPENVRILVTSRPHPGLPPDVPDSHPLRKCEIRELTAPGIASELGISSRRELTEYLFGSDQLATDIIGYMSAAGSGLTLRELCELTGASQTQLESRLGGPFGRGLTPRIPTDEPPQRRDRVYLLAHELLYETARHVLAYDLDRYRQRIHGWADEYRARGWPADTPRYLLRPYGRLLANLGDLDRLVAMATDAARQNRMLDNRQREAALAEVVAAHQLVLQQPQPNVAHLEVLAAHRDRLAATSIPD
jgi:hypothetical protein